MSDAFVLSMSQRIGWTLVHSVWQFALLAMLLGIGLRFVRGTSSHLRYAFMVITLCTMPIGAVTTVALVDCAVVTTEEFDSQATMDITSTSTKQSPGETVSAVNEPSGEALSDGRPDGLHRSTYRATSPQARKNIYVDVIATVHDSLQEWMNVILVAWLLGMLVLSIRLLVSWRATRDLRRRGRSLASTQIVTVTARLAERLRIRQAIEITQSTLVEVPTVIGWLKPLVLLPATALSGLSSEQLEAVIAHELAHVRRHDYLVNLFQLLMETVFFYHPAVWWVSNRMRVEREACCDDIAIQMTGDRVGYARLLLWLEESRRQSTLATLGMSSRGGSLLGRIHRIVSAPSQTSGVGTLAISAAAMLLVSLGSLLLMTARATSAMESTQPAAAPRDTATIRSWLKRSIEFEDWSRLTQLAQLLAEKGEYEESIEWLSKVPVGDPRDGKYSSESYYKVITKICENALKHERLDFVERVLDQLFNPEKQSPTSKKFPPMVFDVAIAILEFHLSKGEIDTGLEYLNSHPKSSHASLVHGAAATASDNGHADHVEAFSKRLSDPEMRAICQRMLANHYAWRNEPENIWRLANQIAIDQPDDLMAQVAIRDSAMRSYARSTPDRFAELVPIHRELIAKLPDAEPVPVWDSVESFSSGEPQRRLPDAEQVRYLGDLALYAAYAKRYELAVELSANVPMLTTSGSIFMDLSGSDRHPVLYGITELQKGHEFDRALAIVDRVKNEAVKLASLARLANCTGFGSDRAEHQESYELMVERLTLAYLTFARQHDEATVLDTYDGLPESINIHLQRVSHPSLSPDEVPYFNRGRLLKRSEYFDLLIEQEKIDEVVRHAEDLLSDGDVNGAKWIVTMLGDAGQAEAFERLRAQVKQAFNVQESGDSKAAADIWDYRHFLDQSALSAYYSGQRDLCYETFMKLDRNWMSPSMVSKVAYKAWQSDDMAFLRRMESSPSRLMREAALERLAVHHVLKGDIESVKETSMTFDREFGAQNKSWSIYRTITDDRIITEPTQLLATMQFALQQVPFESNDYAVIAVQRAKLLGQHYPSKPLPAEWLKKLDHNPKLKYQVEVAHAFAL